MTVVLTQSDIDVLRRLEEELWTAATRFDRAYMNEIFAADFFEIGRSGNRWSREKLLSYERATIDAVIPLPQFEARALSDQIVQVTYESHVTSEGVVEYARRSSIWSRAATASGWQLRFHQGTPFRPNL